MDPQPLEAAVVGRGGEPGDGHPDRRCPGGVRWPVGGRGRQEEGEAVVMSMEGLQGLPGPAADGIGRGLAELIDHSEITCEELSPLNDDQLIPSDGFG